MPKSRQAPTLLVTKYMGSKKAILDFVIAELTRLTEPGDIIIDLMAGTHTIGYAMKDRCRMVANDIQRYSMVIGQTLLNYNQQPRFEGEARLAFRRFFAANTRHLEGLFELPLHYERRMMTDEVGQRPSWIAYRDFCEDYPYFMRPELVKGWPEEFLLLFTPQRLAAYRTLHKLEPYSLFSLYYGNSYIGVRQALEIDSLRYAVDKLCDEWLPEHSDLGYDPTLLRCLLMSALIAVLNKINPSPGHWAAIPRVTSKSMEWLINQRRINVFDAFFSKIADFEAALAKRPSPHSPHIVMTEDYTAFMREVYEYIRQARIIYLDPPYSQGHYSRFYHLLETLVLYDYPEVEHLGRYRKDRHQSVFAHKSKVGPAVGQICEVARDAGTLLVISYSHGGVIPDAEAFRTILEQYYPSDKIELKTLKSVHSKLGQADRMKTEEYLFTCKP